MPGSGADLFIDGDGAIRPIQVLDVDGDSWPDLVTTSYTDGVSYTRPSSIHRGGPEGFADGRKLEIESAGTVDCALGDIDGDGHVEVVFANTYLGNAQHPDSYIYWGGPEGPGTGGREIAPSDGATAVAIADFDRDGRLDLAIANSGDGGGSHAADSFVYLGDEETFDWEHPIRLPTLGAQGMAVGDIDRDGWLDVVFANYRINMDVEGVDSVVYWGGPDGPSPARRTELPTVGAYDATLADLDGDGWLDVLIGESNELNVDYHRNVLVFWGAPDGLDPERRTELPSVGAQGVSVADVDRDGSLDVVVSNYWDGAQPDRDSWIYLGGGRLGPDRRLSIRTLAADGNSVADLNGDTWPELFFASRESAGEHELRSRLFYGGPEGYDPLRSTRLSTIGASGGVKRDPGNVYDRVEEYLYLSSIHDAGAPTAAGALQWEADVPEHTSIAFQIRSGAAREEVAAAPWRGPDGTDATWQDAPGQLVWVRPDGRRYWQYRARLRRSRSLNGPVLRAVTLVFAPPPPQ